MSTESSCTRVGGGGEICNPVELKPDFFWVGAMDPSLRVFDIVMRTPYGTTYNSYLLMGTKKTVLFDTVKNRKRFRKQYFERLSKALGDRKLDYIVIHHAEPDHSSALAHVLDKFPGVTVLGSRKALTFVSQIINRSDFKATPVETGTKLDIGTFVLEFELVPNVHWPDTMFTRVHGLGIALTCDFLGMHYSPATEEEMDKLGLHEKSFKYYYDTIMGPFPKDVLHAVDVLRAWTKDEKDPVDLTAISHGPILRHHAIQNGLNLYEEYAKNTLSRRKDKILIAFTSAYGFTEQLAQAVADGIEVVCPGQNVAQMINMTGKDASAALEVLPECKAVILGTPTINRDGLPQMKAILAALGPYSADGLIGAVFGSFGWSSEAITEAHNRLLSSRIPMPISPLRIQFRPSRCDLLNAQKLGESIARAAILGEKVEDFLAPHEKDDETAQEGQSAEEVIDLTQQRDPKKGIYNDGIMRRWQCVICGEIVDSVNVPQECPVCFAGPEAFVLLGTVKELEATTIESTPFTGTIVIIGSGCAAVNAAEAARNRAPDSTIMMVTADDRLPYNRTLLSRLMGPDVPDPDKLTIRTEGWFEERKIKLQMKTRVTNVDYRHKQLTILVTGEDGSQSDGVLSYDRLIIASGAMPFIPPSLLHVGETEEVISYSPSVVSNVRSIRTIEDAIRSREMVFPGSRGLIIGGGILSMETVAPLAAGVGPEGQITVIEMGPSIMTVQLPPHFAHRFQQVVEKKLGVVTFRPATGVTMVSCQNESISEQKSYHAYQAILSTGEKLEIDWCVVAAGIRPTVPTGIETERGAIMTNNKCQATVPHIWAAGDCACVYGRPFMATWAQATSMGAVAGFNAAYPIPKEGQAKENNDDNDDEPKSVSDNNEEEKVDVCDPDARELPSGPDAIIGYGLDMGAISLYSVGSYRPCLSSSVDLAMADTDDGHVFACIGSTDMQGHVNYGSLFGPNACSPELGQYVVMACRNGNTVGATVDGLIKKRKTIAPK